MVKTKTIDTLIEDILELVDKGLPEDFDDDKVHDLGNSISTVIKHRLTDRSVRPTLRMSNIGKPCERQTYYEIHNSEEAEPLPPQARLKFLFGDILEELLLFLAEASGHTVTGRQDEMEIEGVKGHRDAVIDGVTVDAKSASTFSFKKFQEGNLNSDDPFGYIDQLQSYIHAGQDDPLVTDKSRGAFLVIDKTLGNICLDIHKKKDFPYEALYRHKKEVMAGKNPPERGFEDVPDGKSGNRKLGMNCSYCAFKDKCWPGLRTFAYSGKPVFLTKVIREPKVQELT